MASGPGARALGFAMGGITMSDGFHTAQWRFAHRCRRKAFCQGARARLKIRDIL